jgi:hypothetical protein
MDKDYVANLKEEIPAPLSVDAIDRIFRLLQGALLAAVKKENRDISDELLTIRMVLLDDVVELSDIGNLTFHEQSGKVFMMTLQNCLIKQTNIKETLSKYRFVDVGGRLVATNPPELKLQDLVKVLEEV